MTGVAIATSLVVRIQTRVYQETNGSKLHWAALKKRHDQQKEATWLTLCSLPVASYAALKAMQKWHVSIVPYGNKTMDDDGLSASCKWIRDTIARFLKVDDGDTKRIRFSYAQPEEQDKVNRFHVDVTFSPWIDKATPDEVSLLARAVAAEHRVEDLEDEIDGLKFEISELRRRDFDGSAKLP